MQEAARCVIHSYDIPGRGTARDTENSRSCWGSGDEFTTKGLRGVLWGVGTVLCLNLGGYVTICIDPNSKNYTLKRVHFAVQSLLIMKKKKKLQGQVSKL